MAEDLINMTSREFVFICKNAGLSQRKFAKMAGLSSGSAIYYWELQFTMHPYQVSHLKNSMNSELWESCRLMWERKEQKVKARREESVKKLIEEVKKAS